MGDLEALETVLGQVSGTDFAGTFINPQVEKVCAELVHAPAPFTDLMRAAAARLVTLTATNPADFNTAIRNFATASLMLGTTYSPLGPETNPADIPANKVAEHALRAQNVVKGGDSGSSPGWTGEAAQAFSNDFAKLYTDGGQTVEAQRWMFNAMQLIAEAHQAVYVRTRDDANRLMQVMVNGAEVLKGGVIAGTAHGNEKLILTVVAAVASVGLTVLNPPAGIALAVPLISATASAVSSVVGSIPDKQPVEFDIVTCQLQAMVTSFDAAVSRLEVEHRDRLARVETVLTSLTNTLGDNKIRELVDGPEINGGTLPVHYDGNGVAHVDEEYLGGFEPPPR